jgi:hypothetical protein
VKWQKMRETAQKKLRTILRSQVSRWCVRPWDVHRARSRRSRHSQRYVRPLKPRRGRTQAIPSYRTRRRTSRALPSIHAEHASSGNHRLQTSLSSEEKKHPNTLL